MTFKFAADSSTCRRQPSVRQALFGLGSAPPHGMEERVLEGSPSRAGKSAKCSPSVCSEEMQLSTDCQQVLAHITPRAATQALSPWCGAQVARRQTPTTASCGPRRLRTWTGSPCACASSRRSRKRTQTAAGLWSRSVQSTPVAAVTEPKLSKVDAAGFVDDR